MRSNEFSDLYKKLDIYWLDKTLLAYQKRRYYLELAT